MADLLDHHRIVQFFCEPTESLQRAAEIGVAVGLHRLLQWIGMHRNGIRADSGQCCGKPGAECVADLGQADVADQQDVRGQIADLKAGRSVISGHVVVEHDALRAQHHAHAQLLGRVGQVAVDGARQLGAAGHRADQHRRRKR